MCRVLAAVRRTIVVASCLAAGACGLFEPRDPAPLMPPPQGCRPLTTGTLAVVLNTQEFYGRAAGLTCYSSMLDPSFMFHPDGQDSSQALPQTPFIAWTDSVESRVCGNIASLQDTIFSIMLTDKGGAVISPDQTTELRFYDYLIQLRFDAAPDTIRFTGVADLTFHRGVDGQWRITDWVDHRGGASDSTWGLLRRDHRF